MLDSEMRNNERVVKNTTLNDVEWFYVHVAVNKDTGLMLFWISSSWTMNRSKTNSHKCICPTLSLETDFADTHWITPCTHTHTHTHTGLQQWECCDCDRKSRDLFKAATPGEPQLIWTMIWIRYGPHGALTSLIVTSRAETISAR